MMFNLFKKKHKTADIIVNSNINSDHIKLPAPYMPSIQSITNAGIVVYWKKPQGLNGYEIYRSYKKKELGDLVKIINDPLLGVWNDLEFDHSVKRIYYRVRGYKDLENGTRCFSDFTEQFYAEYRETLVLERDVTILHSGLSRVLRAFYGWTELDDAVWFSSDESVAIVDSTGLITGISKGECTVICKSPSLNMSAESGVIIDRSAPEPLTDITSRYEKNPETGIYSYNNSERHEDAIIMMAGDMMCGLGQIKAQYNNTDGWNFNDSFEYVREVTKDADFTIGNLETLLDPAWPYMSDEWFINNISNCNAPSRYLDAIKYGGFDGVIMANNHACDGGVMALKATIDQVDRYKLLHTGAFRDNTENRYMITDVNGIRVGFVAYMSEATGYKGKDRRWSKEEKQIMLNNFSQSKAEKDIKDCRNSGAEYVIAYMHWGEKNYQNPTSIQRREAQEIADAGADYIVGSNPHVLECYDPVLSADGRSVPCFYSIGNFHARMNQVVGNRDSVIVRIRLKKIDGEIVLDENTYIPFYTYSKLNGNYLPPVSLIYNQHNNIVRKGRKTKYDRIKSRIGDKIDIYKANDK